MVANQNKGAAIRQLHRAGFTPRQIIDQGYARTSVYRAIGKQGAKRAVEEVLADVLATELEILRIVRKLAHLPGPLD